MNEDSSDVLIPFYGCAKRILGEINDAHVIWVLKATGIVVDDVTADGLPYCRIHDSYAGLGFGQIVYKAGVYRDKEIDYPELYLTRKGIAAFSGAFSVLIATADKAMVYAVVGKGGHPREDAKESAVKIPKFDRVKFLSDIKNSRIKSSPAAA